MKTKSLIFIAAMAIFLGGCFVKSLHPFFKPEDVLFKPGMVGTWMDQDSAIWYINQLKDENVYDIKIHKLALDDIFFLQGYGDYVKIHLKNEMLIVHETPMKFQDKLPDEVFIKIHKSYIISLHKRSYIKANRVKILDQLLPISLTYRPGFFQKVKQ